MPCSYTCNIQVDDILTFRLFCCLTSRTCYCKFGPQVLASTSTRLRHLDSSTYCATISLLQTRLEIMPYKYMRVHSRYIYYTFTDTHLGHTTGRHAAQPVAATRRTRNHGLVPLVWRRRSNVTGGTPRPPMVRPSKNNALKWLFPFRDYLLFLKWSRSIATKRESFNN